MDVIERHVRRLPPLDDRWTPRRQERAALADALLEGEVAGTATHPLDNVRANALMLIDGDSDTGPYPFLPAEGEGLHQIPVGPVHAGIIEPGHFRFTANGETIARLEQRLGYVHKGIDG